MVAEQKLVGSPGSNEPGPGPEHISSVPYPFTAMTRAT